MNYNRVISSALGKEKSDLVLKNAVYLNVFTDSFEKGDIAITDGHIVGIGEYSGKEEIDLNGMYVVPSFIDAHIHLESTMLTVENFCKAVLKYGTTSVIIDPHEIANVLGTEGISYILKSSKYKPMNVYVMLPSCVPATPWETSGANLDAIDLLPFLDNPWVLGLAEVMNYPGVIMQDEVVIDKLKISEGRIIDGHCPSLSGKGLNAYISCHIYSDHECTTAEEALEKLKKGMHIFIREGTTSRNLLSLLPIVNEKTYHYTSFCSDDREPNTLIEEGHINNIIEKSIKHGINPIWAYKMASFNTARYFKLKNLGAIAPGYIADLVVLENIEKVIPKYVIKNGKVIVSQGKLLYKFENEKIRNFPIRGSINIPWLKEEDFKIKGEGKKINVIGIIPNQIITKRLIEDAKIENGFAVSDIERDILKIVVIERHFASGRIGKGFVKGFKLKKGAIASSVAHDSHNLIVVGVSDSDILTAAIEINKMQGGMCVVSEGKVLSRLPLPIAGLMSTEPVEVVAQQMKSLLNSARELGCELPNPFLALSFLALPVIPELKITDKGLFDVKTFSFCKLFEE